MREREREEKCKNKENEENRKKSHAIENGKCRSRPFNAAVCTVKFSVVSSTLSHMCHAINARNVSTVACQLHDLKSTRKVNNT